MPDENDEIFLLKDNAITPLPSKSMRTGLLGKSLEEALQQFIEKFPKIMPGRQIEPESDDPPRFVLLRREMPVGGWSLDHLFVDQTGILTLVETKLFQNPESRREVIGQIIEYAANAYTYWGNGLARQKSAEYWSRQQKGLDDILRENFGEDIDIDAFWNNIEENLKDRRVRLIIATDELRPEVSRMIEYLNDEMKNTAVLGLEIKFYGAEDNALVMVPRIYGISKRKEESGSAGKGASALWTAEKLKASLAELPDDILRHRLKRVLDWVIEKNYFQPAYAMCPVFGIRGKHNLRIISLNYAGVIYLFTSSRNYLNGESERDAFVNELKAAGIVDRELDPTNIISGRNLNVRLQDMEEDVFSIFIDILDKYLRK